MIQRILTAVLALVFIVLTFVFASLLVALALTAGAIAWAGCGGARARPAAG